MTYCRSVVSGQQKLAQIRNKQTGSTKNADKRISKKIPLALSIVQYPPKNKRVINILANLQAYFNNRRYFPILMLKFEHGYIQVAIFVLLETLNSTFDWIQAKKIPKNGGL